MLQRFLCRNRTSTKCNLTGNVKPCSSQNARQTATIGVESNLSFWKTKLRLWSSDNRITIT